MGSSDQVTANYSGDGNHSAGSGSLTQTVSPVSTSTDVGSSLSPSGYGQAVSFTATVTGSNPTGTVQFSIDGSNFGSPVTLTSGAAASASISTLAAGTHTIAATYSGDAINGTSTGTLSQVVNSANAGVVVASSLNPSVYGQSVTFTATINAANGLVRRRNGARPMDVTGTVTWSGNTGCATSTVSYTPGTGTGTASCTTTILPAGSADQVTASYSGDSNHNSGSGSVNQEVDAAGTTVSVASSQNPTVFGQSVTFTATINAANGLVRRSGVKPMDVTGTVTWSSDTGCGTTAVSYTTGTGTGTATCTTATLSQGDDVITAAYSGDSNHSAGTGTLSGGQQVNAPLLIPTITWTTPAVITYGKALSSTQLNAKAKYNNRTVPGTFTYTPAAGTILTPGTHTLSVTFTPTDTNTYATAVDSVTLVVNPIKPTMKATSTKDGLIVTMDFSVAATYGQPTGSITVSSNDGGPSCTGTLTSGAGACTLTFSTGGTYTLTLTYSGDGDDESITATRTVIVSQLHTTTKVTSLVPASPVTQNEPVTVNFSVTAIQGQPTGSVTITSNLGGPSCTGTLTNGTGSCTLTGFASQGTYTITATYSGDSNDATSSINHNVRVVAAPQQ